MFQSSEHFVCHLNQAVRFFQNKTSWVVYNLASFYWRMKGDPSAAIECIRRALHFSPEDCKDVALVNLGNILHRYVCSSSLVLVLRLVVLPRPVSFL